jgi:hypothetical protein
MSSPKLRPDDSLTILSDGFVNQLHPLRFLHECDSSYGALTSTPAGLTPAEQTSLSWTHSLANSHSLAFLMCRGEP